MKLIKNNEKGSVYESNRFKVFYRKQGSTSGDNAINDKEEIYLITGKASVTLKEKTSTVTAPAVIIFPANTYHKIVALTDISFILF